MAYGHVVQLRVERKTISLFVLNANSSSPSQNPFHQTHSRRMPPKKKNKYANAAARGFATTSIPKAKPVIVEPEPEPLPIVEPTPPPPEPTAAEAAAAAIGEESEDEFVSLAERIESLSLRKVDAFLGQTQKINVDTLPVLKMEANLENNVIGLLKEVEAKDAGEFTSSQMKVDPDS